MIPVRPDEPGYAKLYDPVSNDKNRYGDLIKLTEIDDNGESLCINGDTGIGDNPNRTRQHAFHFNADNCIGCHACEAACSEKNDLPPHLSFRSVGYVEGGTYPDYTRINISMACNHCDDPVCLKGCPTRAYTKHPEYGAVIQDPGICFGCGYCTWVCPYNAPQLDPVQGQVEKCNMCVDRLEVGLKPACVSACVGNALDFGVVENQPCNTEQLETSLPGFPDPEITHPNIRFQHQQKTPEELTRTDSAPVKYYKAADSGEYKPEVDRKEGVERHWNLARLSSRENPLVIFTLATQAAIGGFIATFVSGVEVETSLFYSGYLIGLLGLVGVGLLMSTVHLGKPMRFYRGFNNLRYSPVSREGLATVIFGGAVFMHGVSALVGVTPQLTTGLGVTAVIAGIATLVFMMQCYLIKARPFWNHVQTVTAFAGAAMYLGGWLFLGYHWLTSGFLSVTGLTMVLAGMLLEAVGLYLHHRDLTRETHEGAASHYIQQTTFGWTYVARNVLLGASVLVVMSVLFSGQVALLFVAAGLTAVSAIVSRALFYVLVIPTTMPGAFFWKNKAFEQHARDIGLADNPAVGVAPEAH